MLILFQRIICCFAINPFSHSGMQSYLNAHKAQTSVWTKLHVPKNLLTSPLSVTNIQYDLLLFIIELNLLLKAENFQSSPSVSGSSDLQTQHSFSAAILVWGGGWRVGGGQEKQVMWDWRLKYFINQCCSQCVVWWLVENSGNPSFPPPTGIQDSPQVLHVMPLFLYFQG